MDFVRALITGTTDTPYSRGCFVFDIYFPSSYPVDPPLVKIITTGNGTVRLDTVFDFLSYMALAHRRKSDVSLRLQGNREFFYVQKSSNLNVLSHFNCHDVSSNSKRKKLGKDILVYLCTRQKSPQSNSFFWLGRRSHFTDSVKSVVLYMSNGQSLRRKPDLERLFFFIIKSVCNDIKEILAVNCYLQQHALTFLVCSVWV